MTKRGVAFGCSPSSYRPSVMQGDAVQQAIHLVRVGDSGRATAILEHAGRQGDIGALAELATWLLRGDVIPRDLPQARKILRQAARLGHVDAALLEVALVASGTGGVPDWQQALSLLSIAARIDPVAADHLDLIGAMRLNQDGYPLDVPKAEILSAEPMIAVFRQAITPRECLHIATIAHPMLERSVVVDPVTRRVAEHPVRTSFNATIGPAQETLPIAAITRRLASITGMPLSHGEPLQVLRYEPGQQYKVHTDALPGQNNQRYITALSYLNDNFRGGETYFPAIGISHTPRTGDILIFRNVTKDGLVDNLSRHAGSPVITGNKWVATRWIRYSSYDPWSM